VALTAKKINLTVVKPGEEFSFNKALGEVSAATGFKPAYVIKSGRTELGDGGGVCQVSSTLFRSALNAGLNITRRLPHSYRVTYYELNSDPGFDATVYAGNVDFRFINDTPGHLLIYTETNSKNLWMKIEIYGTKDGRVATISDYKTWGAAPPPPTEYIPDASLPPGAKKQIDWSASGLKASFNYTVHDANGNLKQQETYTSIYRPWSAKYLVGPSI
jgi:vancomycin resistance protein YoaR